MQEQPIKWSLWHALVLIQVARVSEHGNYDVPT